MAVSETYEKGRELRRQLAGATAGGRVRRRSASAKRSRR